jgi:hypothetical protein
MGLTIAHTRFGRVEIGRAGIPDVPIGDTLGARVADPTTVR